MKLLPRVSGGCINKSFLLLLIVILAATSLMIAKPAFSQTPSPSSFPIHTPSVPTFTVKPVGPPFTVPTTYSLNQSSGQVVAQIGYVIEYPNVLVTIKNQPFTPYIDSSGNTVSFYYNIRIIDNQTSDWIDLYNAGGYPLQSTDSDYTNVSIPVIYGQLGTSESGGVIPTGAQTDIQVEAMIGYITSTYVAYNPNPPYIGGYYTYSFVGQTSNWSPTQTVTIPTNIPLGSTPVPSSSPTPSSNSTSMSTPSSSTPAATSTPTKNPISIYEILIAALVVLIAAFAIDITVLIRRKRARNG